MKINYKKVILFLMAFSFFVPDGMATIGADQFITNAKFLDNPIVYYIIKFLYWTRNAVGIGFCAYYFIERLDGLVKRSYKFKWRTEDIFVLFGIWVLVVSALNHIDLYVVFIQVTMCVGCLIMVKWALNRNQKLFIITLSKALTALLFFNMILAIVYPRGITTGKNYLSTPYYLLGTKNQVTPTLLLASMLFFMEEKYVEDRRILFAKHAVVIANTLIMRSGTGIVCIFLNYMLNTLLRRKRFRKRVSLWGGKKNKELMFLLTCTMLLNIGVVFFDIQNCFGWLITGILNKDLTLTGRAYIWDKGIQQFLLNPIIGYGYGYKIDSGLYGHNLIIELMVTTGVTGLLLYISFFRKVLKGSEIKAKGPFSVPLLCTLIVLAAGNITEAFIYNVPQLVVFSFIAYVNSNVEIREKRLGNEGGNTNAVSIR